jgi:hypothetical protein
MTDVLQIPLSMLAPLILGLYALVFLAGGISYLEQRAARIRDQFPRHGLLARLTGYAALSIGLLASVSIAGYLIRKQPTFQLGALVATVAGIGFWTYRIHFDLTPASRVRDGLLALICTALAVLTWWWLTTA